MVSLECCLFNLVGRSITAGGKATRLHPSDCDPHCRLRLLAGKSLRDELTLADVGKYVEVDRSLLPEVFSDSPPPQELMHPKGGCRGLQVTKALSASLPGSLMAILIN